LVHSYLEFHHGFDCPCSPNSCLSSEWGDGSLHHSNVELECLQWSDFIQIAGFYQSNKLDWIEPESQSERDY
jgi:hypothetical protein